MTSANDAERRTRDEGPQTPEAPSQVDRASGVRPFGPRLNRRHFIATGAATGAGAMALPAVLAQDEHAHMQGEASPEVVTEDNTVSVPEGAGQAGQLAGFTYFTPFQAAIVAAATSRLIPSDDNSPGAAEAGVVYFIDRQLTDEGQFRSFRGPRYAIGPFIEGEPTQGDQSAFAMQDRWRLGVEGMESYAQQLYGAGFAELEPDQQDRILRDMEAGIPDTFDGASIQNTVVTQAGAGQETSIQKAGNTAVGAEAFFQLLHSYTLAGFFSDPVHGGNRDMVGWKLIGFPGAQAFVYDKWILRYGEEFDGGYKSLAEYQDQFTGGN